MNQTEFERHHHTIRDLGTDKRVTYGSVNKAKRWSRDKQIELDGAIGRGSVRLA